MFLNHFCVSEMELQCLQKYSYFLILLIYFYIFLLYDCNLQDDLLGFYLINHYKVLQCTIVKWKEK